MADTAPDAENAEDWPPGPVLARSSDRLCAACDEPTLTVVTVSIETSKGQQTIGGWALCLNCRATPHPTMEEAPRG